MKPQKILLLVLVLLLSLALAACNSDKAPEAPDCFVFDEHPSSDDITELEGKIIAVNKKYDLVALETVSVDASGMSQRIVKVIDLANENRVLYKDITSTSPTEATPPIEYSLASYPFIKATRWVRMANDKDGNPCYEERYDYHLISKTEHAALIESGLTEDDLSVTAVNNIFIAKHDGVLSWINSDLEIMRNVSADASESYVGFSNFDFDAEYNDFLYTWAFDLGKQIQSIIVYGPNGVACAQYNFTTGTAYFSDGAIGGDTLVDPKVYVLNNGNVLIQECILVEDDGAYDFTYGAEAQKFNLVTKIMDYTTGATTEVECDFIVAALESAYSRTADSIFAFTLAEGYENQALVVSVKDGAIGRETEYVILSSKLEIGYTLENSYLTNSSAYNDDYGFLSITDADASGYSAYAILDNTTVRCRFDWNNELIAKYPTNAKKFVGDCYVTESGIYRQDGTLVFDLEEFDADGVSIVGDSIYVSKKNMTKNVNKADEDMACKHPTECYRIDLAAGKAVLVADGIDEDYSPLSRDGAYLVANMKKEIATVYNRNGDAILIARAEDLDVQYETSHTVTFGVCVGGVYKTYVLNVGDQDYLMGIGGLK